jgi:hypothetical protein
MSYDLLQLYTTTNYQSNIFKLALQMQHIKHQE